MAAGWARGLLGWARPERHLMLHSNRITRSFTSQNGKDAVELVQWENPFNVKRKGSINFISSMGCLLCSLYEAKLLTSGRVFPLSCIHTSAPLEKLGKWEKKNRIVYPPQLPGEPRRPAEIYHCRREIKYSKDKMWYLAKLIKGMSIEQALAQLEFSDKKGAKVIKEVLLEAQEMAVRKHNVEFKSNLHIAESLTGRGQYVKQIRYHGKGMFGIMRLSRCHYFVKLVEGPPPPPEPPKTGFDQAKEYVQELRNRTITHSL